MSGWQASWSYSEWAWATGRPGGKLHQDTFAGQLELELEKMWVVGTPRGKLHWGYLDRLVRAIVGVGSGHRESWGKLYQNLEL